MEKAAAVVTMAVLVLSLLYLSGDTGLTWAGGDGGGTPEPTKTPTTPATGKATATPTPTPAPMGCTPGFWKNHPTAWVGYSSSAPVGGVFAIPFPSLAGATLLQALGFTGGSGVEGAARILLRAAVAALLNSAHPSVSGGYPYTTAQVISMTNAALAIGDRSTMLGLASNFDTANNLGCPLN
ncbi:MAG: hypothetical protein QN168_12540 [Armatimonadota bacterium]|nr:hypothetical protein [Armatimonadota bacterium]